MSYYRQPILIFGYILPGIVSAILTGSILYARMELNESMAEKRKHHASFLKSKAALSELEARLAKERPQAEARKAAMAEGSASTLTAKLSAMREKLPAAEFQQGQFNRQPAAAAFGAAVPTQPSSHLQLSFNASFRAMQETFLDVESRLPQLQLQEFRIERAANQPLLTFRASYTAWEK